MAMHGGSVQHKDGHSASQRIARTGVGDFVSPVSTPASLKNERTLQRYVILSASQRIRNP
jgi:hypothetical protein